MPSGDGRFWLLQAGKSMGGWAQTLVHRQIALVTPGDPGDWRTNPGAYAQHQHVAHFASHVREEDVIAVVTRPNTIHSVGIVAGPYAWLPQFEDVNGVDMQHGRRVRWHTSVNPWIAPEPLGLGRLPFAKVQSTVVRDYCTSLLASEPREWQRAPLLPLPPEDPPLDAPPAALADLVALAADLNPLYWDPVRFGEPPSEHEIVTHFVAPLLRALRWPAEQVALEWKRTDVAVFHRLPRTRENLAFIVEAKKLGVTVESVLSQAIAYLNNIGVARDVVVTDGMRYRLYAADRNFAPAAYANLARLKLSSLALFDRLKRQ